MPRSAMARRLALLRCQSAPKFGSDSNLVQAARMLGWHNVGTQEKSQIQALDRTQPGLPMKP